MTSDNAFIAFTCISLASIGLALIIGTGHLDRRNLLSALSVMIPGKAEKERLARLNEMTRAADRAMAARERGEPTGRMARF